MTVNHEAVAVVLVDSSVDENFKMNLINSLPPGEAIRVGIAIANLKIDEVVVVPAEVVE